MPNDQQITLTNSNTPTIIYKPSEVLLRENEFGIVHVPFLYETAKIQNQIRSLLKTLQRTKYQLFQRTLSVFNGTVMITGH